MAKHRIWFEKVSQDCEVGLDKSRERPTSDCRRDEGMVAIMKAFSVGNERQCVQPLSRENGRTREARDQICFK
jgi:hypothetical protein